MIINLENAFNLDISNDEANEINSVEMAINIFLHYLKARDINKLEEESFGIGQLER